MFFSIGSYDFKVGATEVTIDRQAVRNSAQQILAMKETWTCTALLLGTSSSYLSSKLAALQNAVVDGKDFGLYISDAAGGNKSKSTNWIRNSDALGGTRVVVSPSYPDGTLTEYANKRTVRFVIEAILPLDDADTMLVSFTETVRRTGGGPAIGHIPTLIGKPVKQQLRRHTVYRAVQTGSAVGYLKKPLVPAPLWPNDLNDEETEVNDIAPERIGGDYVNFGVNWTYHFQSAAPLLGSPHRWRG